MHFKTANPYMIETLAYLGLAKDVFVHSFSICVGLFMVKLAFRKSLLQQQQRIWEAEEKLCRLNKTKYYLG